MSAYSKHCFAQICVVCSVLFSRWSSADLVAGLQEMRRTCSKAEHKALVSRLLFILTRCSRLVLSGAQMHAFTHPLHPFLAIAPEQISPTGVMHSCQTLLVCTEEPSPSMGNSAMYGTQPRHKTQHKQRRFSGFPFTSQRPFGGVHKKMGSPRSPSTIARASTLPSR